MGLGQPKSRCVTPAYTIFAIPRLLTRSLFTWLWHCTHGLKGYVKGYISHERQMVVLSAQMAFPPLSTVPLVID